MGMPLWLSTMLLGLGTVFFGLICLIFIIRLMSLIVRAIDKNKAAAPKAQQAEVDEIPERGALCAAISACVATVMGEDVKGLRIVSIKRVNG